MDKEEIRGPVTRTRSGILNTPERSSASKSSSDVRRTPTRSSNRLRQLSLTPSKASTKQKTELGQNKDKEEASVKITRTSVLSKAVENKNIKSSISGSEESKINKRKSESPKKDTETSKKRISISKKETENTDKKFRSSLSREDSETRDKNSKSPKNSQSTIRSSSKDENNKKSKLSASNDDESGDESNRLSKLSTRGSSSPKKNTSRSNHFKDTPESEDKTNKSPKFSKEDSLSKDSSKKKSWLSLLKESSESEDENKKPSKSRPSSTSKSNKKSKSILSNENIGSGDENKETSILSTKSSPSQDNNINRSDLLKSTSLSEDETNKSPKISKGDSSSKDRKKKKSRLSLQKQSPESEDEKKDSPNLSKDSCRTIQNKNSVSPEAISQSCNRKKLSFSPDDSDIVVNRSGSSEIESKSKSGADLSITGSTSKANSSNKSTSPKEISKTHNKKKLSLSLDDVNRSQHLSKGGSEIVSKSNSGSDLLGGFENENDHNIKSCIHKRDSDLIDFSSSPEGLLKDSETKDKSKMKSELATLDIADECSNESSCIDIGISNSRSKKRSVEKGALIDLKSEEKNIVESSSNFEVIQEQNGGLNKSFDSADPLENNNSKRDSCESEDSGIKEMEILTHLGNLNVDTPINELILENFNDQLDEPFFQCNNITPTQKSDKSNSNHLNNSCLKILDMSIFKENCGEDVSSNLDTSKNKEKIDLNSTSPNKTVNQSEKIIKNSVSPVGDRTKIKKVSTESTDDNSANLNKKPRLSTISDVFDCIEEVEKHYNNTPSKTNESVKISDNCSTPHNNCNTPNDSVNSDSKVECFNRCSNSNEDLSFSLDGDINFSTGGSVTESNSVETDEIKKLPDSKKKEKNISPTNKMSPKISRFSISDLDVSKIATENSQHFQIKNKSASQNRKSSIDKGKDENSLKKNIVDKTDEQIEKSVNNVIVTECQLPSGKSTSDTTEKLKDHKKVNIFSKDVIKEVKDCKETNEKDFFSTESERFKSDSDDFANSGDGNIPVCQLPNRKSNSPCVTEKLKDHEVNILFKGFIEEVKGNKETSRESNFSSNESELFESNSDDFDSLGENSENDKCSESSDESMINSAGSPTGKLRNSNASISGKDFIDDEAEEGEETDPDGDSTDDSSEESLSSNSFVKNEKSLRNENNSDRKHSGDSTEMSDSDFSEGSTEHSELVENHISESKPTVDRVLIKSKDKKKTETNTFNEIENTKFLSESEGILRKVVPVKERKKMTENILSNIKSIYEDLQKCKITKNVLSLNSKENQIEEKSKLTVDVQKGDLRSTLKKKNIVEKQEKYSCSGKDKTGEKRRNSEELKSDGNIESLKRKKQKVEINKDTGSSIKCNNFSNFISYPCKNSGERKIEEIKNSDKKIYSSKQFVVESFSKVAGNNKFSNTFKVVQNTCGKFSVEGEKSNEKKTKLIALDAHVVPSKYGHFNVSKEQPKSTQCQNKIITTRCSSFEIKKCASFEKSKPCEPGTDVEPRIKNLQMSNCHLEHRKNIPLNKKNDTTSLSEDPSCVKTEYKAYICNLPITNAIQLKEIFEYEDIKNLKKIDLSICKPARFIKGKGYGYVYFKNENDMKRAINMRHRLKISGRKIMLRADDSYCPMKDHSKTWLIKSLREYIRDLEKFDS